jgi:hypothetical protein
MRLPLSPCTASPCTAPFALSVVLALGACGGGGGSGGAAAEAFEDSLDALKDRKISTYVQSATSKVQLEQMKASWDKERKATPDPAYVAQFREVMAMLTAKDADQQLFAMIKPQLAMIAQQAAGVAAMLPSLASGVGGQQAAPAIDTLSALAERLPELGLQDEQKLQQAIAIVTGTARKLGVQEYDALAKLEFPQMLAKADLLYAGVVDVLAVYGLSLEESLASTEIAVQSATENNAVLAVSYSLFGGPRQSRNIEMARVDGRWVSTTR